MDEALRREFAARLSDILGEDGVSTAGSDLVAAASDMTENEPHPPDVLAFARHPEQIPKVLALAHELGVPVIPRVYNTNLGGLAIAGRGGLLLDLTGMNRILEVNEEDLYMVIEPGVTQEDVRTLLDSDHPGLRFGYSLAPPEVSVLANCLMDGLVNLSYRFGAMGQWLNGLEVVLPGGEVVRTGSAAAVDSWHGDPPLPHLTALFLNSFGTGGVVTRAAVQLWPKPAFEERFFVLCRDFSGTNALMRELARSGLPDDIGVLSWPLGKLLFGNTKPTWRGEEEPLFFFYTSLSSPREAILEEKKAFLEEAVAKERRAGHGMEMPLAVADLVKIEPSFAKFSEFPARLDFLLDHGGGGLTWIGTYGPSSHWREGVEAGMSILEKSGRPPIVVTRPMWGGHYIVLRFIVMFDREDRGEVAKVRKICRALYEEVIELGFIPYKTPPWAYRLLAERMDPVFRRLMKGVKDLLDPKGIMNPDKWPV